MTPSYKWLLLEGVIPLLGAAVLFLVWGACRYLVAKDKSTFRHDWWAALDPVGWLYGGAVLAAQAGVRCAGTESPTLTTFCFGAAGICLLVLIAAMSERASDTTWQPPPSLRASSIVLVIAILYAGYEVSYTVTAKPEQQAPTPNGSAK